MAAALAITVYSLATMLLGILLTDIDRRQMSESKTVGVERFLIDTADRGHLAERLKRAEHFAHFGHWRFSVADEVLEMSDEVVRIYGYPADEPFETVPEGVGRYHPDDQEAVNQHLATAIETGEGFEFELRIVRLDGKVRDVYAKAECEFGEDGKVTALFGIIQDITERKRAEHALRESEEKYRNLFDTMLNGFALHEIVLDDAGRPCDFRFLEVNRAFERISGLGEDVAGKTVLEIFPTLPKDRIEIYANVALTGEPTHFDHYSDAIDRHLQVYAYCPRKGQFATIFSDVTETKRAEAALRESEQKYRGLFDTMLNGFILHEIILDDDGKPVDYRFLEANPAAVAMTGMTPDVIGKAISEVAPAFDKEWIEKFGHVAMTGESFQFQSVMDPNGRHYDASVYSPKKGQFATVFQDITERVQAEEKLRKNEALLSEMERIARIGGWEYDILSEQTGWTSETYRILEIPEDRRPPKPVDILEYCHADDGPMLNEAFERAIEDGTPFDLEIRCHTATGKPFWSRTIGHPVIENGQCVRVFGSFQDITERKDIETALKESRERFYLALNHIPDVVVLYDRDLRIQFINEATTRITGLPTSHFLGKRDDEVWPPEIYETYLPSLREAFSTGQLRTVDTELKLTDGESRYLHISCIPVLDESGVVREVLGVTHDYTDEKRTGDQLRQAQKMEAVGQLSGGLAHDLNNVLGIILMNAEMLHVLTADNLDSRKHYETIMKGIRRGSDLTRKMLDFSRTEAGKTKRVSVNGFVHGMEGLIGKSLTPAISMETHLAEGAWPVQIDPGDLENAILNLALNARDAMPDGGSLIIETANKVIDEGYVNRNPGSSAGDFVMVSISDTGTGMTPQTVDKAFDPFFTTKEVGEGTGLGLSMVYGFIKRSGGHVKIYSELGEGTTIRLYLPRAPGVGEDGLPRREDGDALPGGGETILVVDDEEDLIDAAVRTLGVLGYRTITSTSGTEVLEILRRDSAIDLLFCDVIMPGEMDGYRLALEALKKRPDLKVLLTSGFTSKREESVNGDREVVSKLAKSMLQKPYNIAELAAAIRRTLDGGNEEGSGFRSPIR